MASHRTLEEYSNCAKINNYKGANPNVNSKTKSLRGCLSALMNHLAIASLISSRENRSKSINRAASISLYSSSTFHFSKLSSIPCAVLILCVVNRDIDSLQSIVFMPFNKLKCNSMRQIPASRRKHFGFPMHIFYFESMRHSHKQPPHFLRSFFQRVHVLACIAIEIRRSGNGLLNNDQYIIVIEGILHYLHDCPHDHVPCEGRYTAPLGLV